VPFTIRRHSTDAHAHEHHGRTERALSWISQKVLLQCTCTLGECDKCNHHDEHYDGSVPVLASPTTRRASDGADGDTCDCVKHDIGDRYAFLGGYSM
jgi:hypothetical protein